MPVQPPNSIWTTGRCTNDMSLPPQGRTDQRDNQAWLYIQVLRLGLMFGLQTRFTPHLRRVLRFRQKERKLAPFT